MAKYVSNVIRLAEITSVNYDDGIAFTRWLDQGEANGPTIPIPHPFANKGGSGIFVGIRVGTIVALAMASYERWVPAGIVPIRAYYGDDVTDMPEAEFDDVGFPNIESGEIILHGPTGSEIRLGKNGIKLENEYNEGFILTSEDDHTRCLISVSPPVEYNITHAGTKAQGIVRRDIRVEDGEEDFFDFLVDPDSEAALEEIGWDPSRKVTYVSRNTETSGATGSTSNKNFRNPAFIENKTILLEYGREWNVGTYDEELARMQGDEISLREPEDRSEHRNNVLGLSLTNPNELIEEIYGTVVDIFGNPVDINRSIIGFPNGKDAKILLNDTFEKARHTIAYHKEINTRKGWGFREDLVNNKKPILLTGAPDPLSAANNARDRSRWFIDVDKEGLTKINVPATSETGNIPLLTRYETSSVIEVDNNGNPKNKARNPDDARKIFRNEKNQDIFLDQFGPGGIALSSGSPKNRLSAEQTSWVEDSKTLLPFTVEAGTAFHDITKTAATLLNENINNTTLNIAKQILQKPTDTVNADIPAISEEVSQSIPKADTSPAVRDSKGLVKNQPNAGGRSVHLNLDGSLETSIGANTVDRVSWTLDTAGALVARLGRDRSGRSAIVHADGSIVLEIGGYDFIGENGTDEVDSRFVGRGDNRTISLPLDQTRFRDGKLVIRVRRSNLAGTSPSNEDHLIIFDPSGVTIQSAGIMNLVSKEDMNIKSETGVLRLDGVKVQIYEVSPRNVARSGRTIL